MLAHVNFEPCFFFTWKNPIFRVSNHSKVYKYILEED
ncbi:hypothetical protein F383_36925 [Gossypium arboreum]|uniref:Uncharacterized protein n=1 Tax=Gossypium arboreum TaxID=29729 RepID=A0A0B0MEJ6_GOSAR|nr:hypothetical protein F383_36925 [Gossypium arboreum]